MSRVSEVLTFPNPVNEKAARSVAGCVVVLCIATIALTTAFGHGWLWLSVPLAYGFLARVAAGPRFSPIGRLGAQVIAPRLGRERLVPGPPKRFAQAIGATLSVAALVVGLGFGLDTLAVVLVAMIAVAATLESVLGFCLGCSIFGVLMRHGIIPEDTCAACNDVSARLDARLAAADATRSGTLAG